LICCGVCGSGGSGLFGSGSGGGFGSFRSGYSGGFRSGGLRGLYYSHFSGGLRAHCYSGFSRYDWNCCWHTTPLVSLKPNLVDGQIL
jgi:hypothetical protein